MPSAAGTGHPEHQAQPAWAEERQGLPDQPCLLGKGELLRGCGCVCLDFTKPATPSPTASLGEAAAHGQGPVLW